MTKPFRIMKGDPVDPKFLRYPLYVFPKFNGFRGYVKDGVVYTPPNTTGERIEQRRLTQEQQDDLEAHHKLGAVAFVLVSVSLTDFYRVPWPVWRDMAEIYGRKYMTHAELSRYEVPATAGFIKFLHGIEPETLGKEDAHDPTP